MTYSAPRVASGEATHVVEDERIGARGIGDLREPRIEVIGVIYGARIGIGLLDKPVRLVVGVGDRLAFPVCLAGEVVVRVIQVG